MFKYDVTYWDEVDSKTRKDAGLTTAKSWGEAVEKVREYYGEKNTYSVSIEEWDDTLSKDEVVAGLTA